MRAGASLLALLTLCLVGCAGFHPRPIEEVPFLERAESREDSQLTVTVAVPSIAESRELFDTKLHKKRVQPVWVEVRNDSDEPVWFFPFSVDPAYFPPLEVAWRSHRTWARKTNRRIDAYYYQQAVRSLVEPGRTESGFVFVNLDRGAKYVPVQILRDGGVTELEFVFEVPGFRADFQRVDFERLYDERRIEELADEHALREWVTGLACCTENRAGTKTGDPLNFVVVAPGKTLARAFLRAGWDLTAEKTGGSSMKTVTSAVLGKSYRNAPMSPLYALGRPQDLGLQKARWNIHQRNHLRMWLAPVTYRGANLWIGQISRDIGSRITTKSPTLTTHKIDPDVDDARDYLLLDLWDAGVLEAFGYTTGVGRSTPEAPGRNLTGDPYFTDGLRAVIMLSEETVDYEDIRLFDWERAYEHRDRSDRP